MVTSIGSSSGGPIFDLQHLYDASKISVTPGPKGFDALF